jgi:polar amino acid transport system permease protein
MSLSGSEAAIVAPACAPRQPLLIRYRAHLIDIAQFLVLASLIGWLIVRGAQSMGYNWQWYRVPQYFYRVIDGELIWGPLAKGLLVTTQISALAFVLAAAFGLAIALLRMSASPVGRGIARVYLEAIRNTPLLVQLYLFYFVLAPILDIERFWTGVLCLAIFEGAFASEIFRAGIQSVPRGQWEAADSLGLSPLYRFVFVIAPQALRLILPPLTSLAVSLIKHSAIVSVIAIFDLTNEGRNIIADTFMTFEIWIVVAAIYIAVTGALSLCVSWLESRMKTL